MGYWYDDAIFYSIYPLGAVNDRQENDYVQVTDGMDRLADWIHHIRKIGCNAVYLAPIFESKTHGYDTTDYRKIDSRLGTNAQFTELVEKCHRAGVRVVVDGVFNHTGRDFFAFRDLKENRENSPYKDWYRGVHFGWNTPLNDGFSYEAWRGHFELPRLNPHCPEVCTYLFDTVRGWIEEFDIDGIRLDCADCLDFGFMEELRRVCTGEKEDFWLMGEIIHGDYNRWVNPETLHSVTNYECSKGLYSSHNDGNMHEIAYSLNRQFGNGGLYKGKHLYNFADNHDVNRIADLVKDPAYLPTIYTVLYTMPGIPSIYYGSEWGIRGVSDRVTDWALRPQVDINTVGFNDPWLMDHVTALAKARAESPAIRYGEYAQISVTSHQFSFRREYEGEEVIVLVNIAPGFVEMTAPAQGEKMVDLLSGDEFPVTGGRVTARLPGHGSRVLRAPQAGGKSVKSKDFTVKKEMKTPPLPPKESTVPVKPAIVGGGIAAKAYGKEQTPPPSPSKSESGQDSRIQIVRQEDLPVQPVRKHAAYEHDIQMAFTGEGLKAAFYELAPGKASYPYHYHTGQEEMFLILEGEGTLKTPSGDKAVKAGDLIFFPASEKGAHRITNTSDKPLKYLDVDTITRGDVAFYPHSRKVNYDGDIYRFGNRAGYYEGE